MRAKEIAAGMECYHHASGNWTESMRPGTRVVIVDSRPGCWFRDRTTREWTRSSAHGQHVLVDSYPSLNQDDPRGDKTTPMRLTVTLNTLRGPWAETHQHHAKLIAALQADYRKEQDEREKVLAQCDQTAELLAELGIKAHVEGRYSGHARMVVADRDAVLQLAQAAQQLRDTGWSAATPV